MQVSITQADIEGVWRPLKPAELLTLDGKSNSAWIRIVGAVPDIEAKLSGASPIVTEATVREVMTSMIVRVYKNPDSLKTVSEGIDDRTESTTLDGSVSSGEMYISAAELAMLRPVIVPVFGLYVLGLGG